MPSSEQTAPEHQAHLLDADLLAALTVPSRQGDYPRDSKAFVRIDTSLRVYWHTLFDICPSLLTLSGPDGLAIFRPFMAWSVEQGLSMNWTTYLWVYTWLRQSDFRDRISPEMRLELVAASAARWAVGDRSENKGIVLYSKEMPGLVCGWKTQSVLSGRQIELIELETPLPEPPEPFGFFEVSGGTLDDEFPGWTPIPR